MIVAVTMTSCGQREVVEGTDRGIYMRSVTRVVRRI